MRTIYLATLSLGLMALSAQAQNRIAVARVFGNPGEVRLFIAHSDGSGYQELTSGTSNSSFPSFAPDGKRLVYREFDTDSYGLRILNLESRAISKLTDQYDNFPLWSPRGDLIMFARQIDKAYEIFTIRPDGSGLKQLTHTHGNDAHMA